MRGSFDPLQCRPSHWVFPGCDNIDSFVHHAPWKYPIQDGETHVGMTQYVAGTPFPWVDNRFMTAEKTSKAHKACKRGGTAQVQTLAYLVFNPGLTCRQYQVSL